jgi:hypothetical protein
LNIDRSTLFQFFKYVVYVFLAMNVYWFFAEEFAAARLQFPNGVSLRDMIEAYAATIDTAAWVVLLLMFELETYVLDDQQFTTTVTWSLHGLRAICYAFIIYAFFGYIMNLAFIQATAPLADIADLCGLVTDQWAYAVDIDEYEVITGANCDSFSSAHSFVRFDGMRAVVDAGGHAAILGLAWIDVINSGVWLLVVIVLEVDVWLQEHNRYEGMAFRISYACKVVLYSALLYAAVYWGIKGDFVDFWDAFLWLVAFVFIELNVFEWHQESLEESAVPDGS